jgi:hypothetical protein
LFLFAKRRNEEGINNTHTHTYIYIYTKLPTTDLLLQKEERMEDQSTIYNDKKRM